MLLAGGCSNEGAVEQGQPESNLQFVLIGWWSEVIWFVLGYRVQLCAEQNNAYCMAQNWMATGHTLASTFGF